MEDAGGAPDSELEVLPAGTKLGKYELRRLLGQGGMGAVYEALHLEMGKPVAVKTLSAMVAAVPGAKARFLREAQLTSRVRHPHIVDVTDVGTEGGVAFLVMELLSGEDLSQRLERTGPLPPEALADIMLPVCSAVIAAHQEGVIHRDLKPQNIFLSKGPRGIQPKVLDFGISKQTNEVGGALTRTSAMIGTPHYLAPEQINNARSASPSSDQYALGVILYECLSGQRPFEGDTLFAIFQQIVTGASAPLRTLRPEVPPALNEIVKRAMNVDMAARFPTVRDLAAALLPFASGRARASWEEEFGGPVPATAELPRAVTDAPARAVPPTTPLAPVKTPSPASTTPLPPAVLAGSVPGAARPRRSEDRLDDVEPPRPPRSGRPMLIATAALLVAAIVAVVWALLPGERRPSRPTPRPSEPVISAEPPVSPPPPAEPVVAPPATSGPVVVSPPVEPPAPPPEARPSVKVPEHHRSRPRPPGSSGVPAKPPRARDPSIAPVID